MQTKRDPRTVAFPRYMPIPGSSAHAATLDRRPSTPRKPRRTRRR